MSAPKKPIHGEAKRGPFDPLPEGEHITHTPPEGCPFKVGDEVIFTNDAGLKFRERVRGFTRKPQGINGERVVYIFSDTDAHWFPESLQTITKAEAAA